MASPDSGFFADVNGDREYDMDFLAEYIGSFISNGVYNGELAVTTGGNMNIVISAGRAWNGPGNKRYYKRIPADIAIAVSNADGVLNRKDTVVLRWDINARDIIPQVLTGTPASNPVAPAIIRSAEQYDLKLAEISIPAGTTAITQALITDTRLDNSVCGIVTGVVHQVDTTALYNQIQSDLANFKSGSETGFATWSDQQKAAFNAWFNTVKGQLSGDAAGHLQTEIDTITAAKGQPNGYAGLDANGKLAQMPTAAQVGALKNVIGIAPASDLITWLESQPDIGGIFFTQSGTTGTPTAGEWDQGLYSRYPNGNTAIIMLFANSGQLWIITKTGAAWKSWTKPDANKSDYASGSAPLTTPGLRNAIVINKTDSIPAGLPDGTIVLRKQV